LYYNENELTQFICNGEMKVFTYYYKDNS